MYKRFLFVVFVLVVLTIAAQSSVQAQGGPSFSVTFNPSGSQNVGQDVNIHVKVDASTYGASKITPSCGGVSKTETSELEYDSTWHTNGCQGGNQNVQVCTKTAADEQWMSGNCQNFGYTLTGSNPSVPTVQFWADTGNLQQGQCTTMHWRTSGTDSVNIDGDNYNPNGDLQICPQVTRKYSLSATGPGGTAYANFEVTVSTVPQPQNQGPTNPTQIPPTNVPQPNNGGNSNDCGSVPSRLKPGMLAVVSDQYPDPLYVYHSIWGEFKFNVPIYEKVSIVSGSVCSKGRIWVEVGYQGNSGWAVEVAKNGSYNLIPDGMPMPGGGKGQQNQNPVTNALGTPLAVMSNGDLVYPKTTGSGGDLCVKDGINSLFLKVNPTTDSTNKNVIGTMTASNCYQLIQVSNGWAQVNTSLGIGWVKANPDWVDIKQQLKATQVPPTPTQIQLATVVSQSTATPQTGATNVPVPTQSGQATGTGQIRCDPVASIVSPEIAMARYNNKPGQSSNYQQAQGGECGEFVINRFKAMGHPIDQCVKEPSGTGENLTANWPNNVRINCPSWVVDQDPIDGAIVTWDANCPFGFGKFAGGAGHAAIVTKTPAEIGNNTILVDESNWVNGRGTPDHAEHNSEYQYPMEPCMHFIHVPGTQGASVKQVAKTILASAVSISCIYCNTNANWVEFRLPSGKYLFNSMVLVLEYQGTNTSIVWNVVVPRSSEGGVDTIRFILDSMALSSVAAGKHLSLKQLNDPTLWYITYTANA